MNLHAIQNSINQIIEQDKKLEKSTIQGIIHQNATLVRALTTQMESIVKQKDNATMEEFYKSKEYINRKKI